MNKFTWVHTGVVIDMRVNGRAVEFCYIIDCGTAGFAPRASSRDVAEDWRLPTLEEAKAYIESQYILREVL
jgi:hypothetical protein